MILHINDLTAVETQYYLQHIVAPRPIALASTIDNKGNVNLSPFSFFNVFSASPPIVIFSPSRRLRNNTIKHTLENLVEVPEAAISIVTYDIIHQVSLSSCEYPKGTDEFIKAGFTKKKSALIRPPLVLESKAALECQVTEIKSLGENGGAGQLIIARVLCMHINDSLLTADKKFLPEKLEPVARMGGEWYARINTSSLFKVPKPNVHTGIGIDALPENIRKSKILTGNHLAQLASVCALPAKQSSFSDERMAAICFYIRDEKNKTERIHAYARDLIDEGKPDHAWQVLLSFDNVYV